MVEFQDPTLGPVPGVPQPIPPRLYASVRSHALTLQGDTNPRGTPPEQCLALFVGARGWNLGRRL